MSIHPTALVHPEARLAAGVSVGPWCVIERDVAIGEGCTLGPFCRVMSGATIGPGVTLDGGAVVGGAPQDLKYDGAASRVEIGAGARLGEYVTVNRSSAAGGLTRIGARALVMAYSHVAHDCDVGAGAIIANAVQLGGHVRVGDGAVISGMTGVHQFTVIGAGAFVGGGLRVDVDVPPYVKALGEPLRWGGLNLTGLRRGGADAAATRFLDGFYRRVYAASVDEALAWMRAAPEDAAEESAPSPPATEKAALEAFFAQRRRGLLKRGRPG